MAEEATSGVRDDRNVCQLCGAFENLSLCSGCRETWYCCKDHQVEDWKQHKRKCKGRRYKGKQQQKAGEAEKPGVSEDRGSAGINGQQKAVTKQSPACASSRISQENSNSQNSDKSKTDVQLDELDVATEWSVAEQLKETTVNDLDPKKTDSSLKKSGGKSSPNQVEARVNTKRAPVQLQKIDGDKNDSDCGGASRRMTSGQLPRAAEEGSDERFFLDAKSFSQTLQLSKHTDRARRSASAMSPQGASLDSQDAYLDVLRHRFAAMARYVADCLKKYDVCVIDGFLGEATGQEILSEVKRLQEIGVMRQGQLVQSTASSSGNIRGDIIAWIDGRGQYCENIQFLVSCMDAVVQTCSSLIEGYTINERTKAMVACYPKRSTGYVRHVDNPNGDGRCITCIYYLNQNWDVKRDGGMLRIYPEGKDTVANIEPIFDRLLFFWSDRRNPHEVLPTVKERYAITVWYYDAKERARALKRFKGEVSDHPRKEAVPLFNGSETGES